MLKIFVIIKHMSNNLLSQTKKFISHIDELTQNSNSQEIHTTAKNIVDE